MTHAADLINTLERTRDEAMGYFSLGDADLARIDLARRHYERDGATEFIHSKSGRRTVTSCADSWRGGIIASAGAVQ